jgi:hypothetical protein
MALKSLDRLKYLEMVLNDARLTTVAFEHFRSITPIAAKNGGNARRNTTKTSTTINANYPYAGRLDEGYSKQAPKGMVEPTWEYLKDYIKKKTGT